MNIDYNNLQNHVEVKIGRDEVFLVDKNHKAIDHINDYKIVKLPCTVKGYNFDVYCDFWAVTSNRSTVMRYFKNKYGNSSEFIEV